MIGIFHGRGIAETARVHAQIDVDLRNHLHEFYDGRTALSLSVFLAIAFVLFVLDIKAPTHGALTAAGVASLIVGSLVLFNSPGTPSFLRVSVPLVIGVSLATRARL